MTTHAGLFIFTTYPDGICPPGTPVSNDLIILTGSFNDEHND